MRLKLLIILASVAASVVLMTGGSGVQATHDLHTEPGHKVNPPHYLIHHDLLPGDGHGAHGTVPFDHDVHDGVLDVVLCNDDNWDWGDGFNAFSAAVAIVNSWGKAAADKGRSFTYDGLSTCAGYGEIFHDLALHSVPDTTEFCGGRHLGCFDTIVSLSVNDNKYHDDPGPAGLPNWQQLTWVRAFYDHGLVHDWSLTNAEKSSLVVHEVGHMMAVWHTTCAGQSVMKTVTVCAPDYLLSYWDRVETWQMYHWLYWSDIHP